MDDRLNNIEKCVQSKILFVTGGTDPCRKVQKQEATEKLPLSLCVPDRSDGYREQYH